MKTLTIELERVVAFHPQIANAVGSIYAALLWQQIYYWQKFSKREDGFIYKSAADIRLETALNTYQQRKARVLLLKMNLMEEKKIHAHGVPTIHYRVIVDKMQEILILPPSKNAFCEGEKMHFATVEKSLTEITTENTTDIMQRGAPPQDDGEGKTLNSLMEEFKVVNPHYERLYGNNTQRAALARLKKAYGEEALRAKIKFLEKNNKTLYATAATTPLELEKKMGRIQAFWEQQKQKDQEGPKRGYLHDGTEVVFLKGEWRDAQNPWTVNLSQAYYPELAKGQVMTEEEWLAKKKSYALQT